MRKEAIIKCLNGMIEELSQKVEEYGRGSIVCENRDSYIGGYIAGIFHSNCINEEEFESYCNKCTEIMYPKDEITL